MVFPLQETMGVDSPEPTFQGMLEFVTSRTEGGKNVFTPEVLLPDTLKELHENYVLIGGSKVSALFSLKLLQNKQPSPLSTCFYCVEYSPVFASVTR